MVSYVHSWQIVLKSLGLPQFEFNTYIITVLVIFFLQMHYDLPTVDEISNPAPKKRSKTVDLAAIARQFFTFYSKNYEIGNHIISPQIGQWQEKRLQREQKNFSSAKKRLRLHNFFNYQDFFTFYFYSHIGCAMGSKHLLLIGITAPCMCKIYCGTISISQLKYQKVQQTIFNKCVKHLLNK